MGRGLLSGVVFGSLVSIAGLSVVSLVAPLPNAMPANDAAMQETSDTQNTASDQEVSSETSSEGEVAADTDAVSEADMSSEPDMAANADGTTEGDMPSGDVATAQTTGEDDGGVAQTAEVTSQMEAPTESQDATAQAEESPSSPVGSLEIEAPQAPDLPADLPEFATSVDEETPEPVAEIPDVNTPAADTDPLEEPVVAAIEGSMAAPEVPESADVSAQPVEPVLPNPQSSAPQTPESEADLTVSTTSDAPQIVILQDEEASPLEGEAAQEGGEDFFVVDLGAPTTDPEPEQPVEAPEADDAGQGEQTEQMEQAVDVADPVTPEVSEEGSDAVETAQDGVTDTVPSDGAAQTEVAANDNVEPRVQLQGDQNTLLDDDRETGVIVNRPLVDPETPEGEAAPEAAPTDAMNMFAAEAGDIDGKALMSIVLIDDGSMSSASAALAGIPFPVTIALDPSLPNAAELMASYREAGFEVAVLAMLPEGALPMDVEITFESIFSTLPETIAVLDIGTGGLQSNREVTEQAMGILADQGRGYVSVVQGLNTAGRAAEAAGVPTVEVFRDLDSEGQDARVIRRFVDNAAFRARQESGVVLVARVRPDTLSALILWGSTAQDEMVALVPVSAILNAQ